MNAYLYFAKFWLFIEYSNVPQLKLRCKCFIMIYYKKVNACSSKPKNKKVVVPN